MSESLTACISWAFLLLAQIIVVGDLADGREPPDVEPSVNAAAGFTIAQALTFLVCLVIECYGLLYD